MLISYFSLCILQFFVCARPSSFYSHQKSPSEQDISILFPDYPWNDYCLESSSSFQGFDSVDHERERRSQNPSPDPVIPKQITPRKVPSKKRKIKILPKTKNYECNECHKKFATKFHVDRHELTHTKQKPFKCGVGECEYYCNREDNLQVHRLTHDSVGDKKRQTIIVKTI